MSIINGHYLRVFNGANAIAKALECSYSLNTEMRETAHKDTAGAGGGFREVEPGQKSGSMTCNALYAEGESFEDLFTAWENGNSLTLRFTDDVSGNKYITATAYVESLEKNAPNNENVSYTVNFALSGAITRATIA